MEYPTSPQMWGHPMICGGGAPQFLTYAPVEKRPPSIPLEFESCHWAMSARFQLRQTEVQDLNPPRWGQENVARLDVAIRDALAMCHSNREMHTTEPGETSLSRLIGHGAAAISYCFSYTAVVGGSVVPAVRLTTFSNLPFSDTVQVDWSKGFPLCVRVILKL
jgi:hypothetical protein